MTDKQTPDTKMHVRAAFYADVTAAERVLTQLMQRDFPMDRVSLLGRASASGDDPLGIHYAGVGERMRGWGTLGALWGGIWGLLTGAAGLFLLPGIGPIVAAGPLVHALTGAAAGGAVMAGAGAAAQLTVVIHRMGIPDARVDEMQQRIERGEALVMLILPQEKVEPWRPMLTAPDAQPLALWELPYTGIGEGLRAML